MTRKPVPMWINSRIRHLWRNIPPAERHQLRAFLRSTVLRVGPPADEVIWQHMLLLTETWWTAREASASALVEGMKRRHGKGRRPTLQAIDRRLKRQGLGISALDQMVRRLEELTAARKRPATPAELVERLRAGVSGNGGHE